MGSNGRVDVGSLCYPKVLAEVSGKALGDRLAKRILSALKEEVGLDLLNPDDNVGPGDRVVGRDLDLTLDGGKSVDEEEHEDVYEGLIDNLSEVLGIEHDEETKYPARASAVDGRVREICEQVDGVHEEMKKIDPSYDVEQACLGVEALVKTVLSVRDHIKRVDPECGFGRIPYSVATLAGHAVRVKNLVGSYDTLDSEAKIEKLQEELVEARRLQRATALHVAELRKEIDQPKIEVSVVAPLLERLLGSSDVSAESVAAALEALGPAPEF